MIAGVISDRSSAASLNAPWGSLNALVGPRPPFHVKDGHHRFSIAEALGLTSIPAVVVVVEGGVCSNGDKQPITDTARSLLTSVRNRAEDPALAEENR